MVLWRSAGINYVRFSQIAAQVTKECSKAGKGMEGHKARTWLKTVYWENGKPNISNNNNNKK
ncbi:hypothetical protein NECAME_02557 [Necator americanus]|uniref:Uncharacterized protein n=1 Tax=Necator americanus TaxID=51031 RepID=W2TDR4_NECAM|nr:hypothetical protein NECAME_02557 [Necator americanus]ETN79734.1 hypothetical protein NECAME_02557 [Necator americanus]